MVPETGNIEFNWSPSPSADISAYLVYEYHSENGIPRGDIIDTIWDPSATSYLFVSPSSKYGSRSYVVAAYREPVIAGTEGCPSRFSNVLNTIFAEAVIDTCNKRITTAWNSYPSSPREVTGYSVLVSVNGGSLNAAQSTDPSTRSILFTDFETNSDYCYVVRADLADGSYSTSNKSCLSTDMLRPPEWINADYATVTPENEISLSFTADAGSEISLYRLERKTGDTQFSEIAALNSADGHIEYTDIQPDISQVNTYRLSAVNSCNIPVTVSNLASNIVLAVQRNGDDIGLSWNHYREWLGEISSYVVFVKTGSSFEQVAELPGTDSVFTVAYNNIMYLISGNDICFYVRANEAGNPHGVAGVSNSSTGCSLPTELITVPNVFTPNNDLVNDYFRPVLSFTAREYHLRITDRNGRILFESDNQDEEWDGSGLLNTKAGSVCLWFLEVKTPSGKQIKKTGTVTIIRKTN